MPDLNMISPAQLMRLLGTPDAPVIVDVRIDADVEDAPHRIPTAIKHAHTALPALADRLAGRPSVIVCHKGQKLSQGTAAYLRAQGLRSEAIPFDVPDVRFTHRNTDCTFDAILADFNLLHPALNRLADIVRAADCGRPEDAPQAAGLLAASIGLGRMYRDDTTLLNGALPLYDAFYRWARDGHTEDHNTAFEATS